MISWTRIGASSHTIGNGRGARHEPLESGGGEVRSGRAGARTYHGFGSRRPSVRKAVGRGEIVGLPEIDREHQLQIALVDAFEKAAGANERAEAGRILEQMAACLLYTSPSPRDR